jgi:hypothetical protein
VFEGLSADRLGREVNAALRSIVFFLITDFNLSLLPYVDDVGSDESAPFINAALDVVDEPTATQLLTSIWQLWFGGAIPTSIGHHFIRLAPKGESGTWIVIGAVTVTGLIASIPGTFSRSILRDAAAGTIDRVHIAAKFEQIKGPLTLQRLNSEEDLADSINKAQMRVVMRVRVPRIATSVGYWPPTEQAVEKAKALFAAGKPLTFDDIESSNIADAWLVNKRPR